METIYVIDDRATNRKVLKRLAHAAETGADIKTFADPREAIDDAARHAPDLVVTDFEMPHMNGAEFTRHFRAMPMCYDVPVIVVTAYENKQSRYQALEFGATDFMLSPVDHQEFQARVRNFMRMRMQQKQASERTRLLERRIADDSEQLKEAIAESEDFLRQVIDAVPALISVNGRDGSYRAVNSYLSQQYGAASERIVGKKYQDILGEFDAQRHGQLDQEIFASGHGLPTFEEELVDALGERRTYLTVKSPIRGPKTDHDTGEDISGDATDVAAVVSVSLDISDRKRVERIAAHQQNRLRVILDNIPNFVSATDDDGRFTLVNLALAGALGTTPDAMIGSTLADHVSDENLIGDDLAAHSHVLETGRPMLQSEQRFVARDKTMFMQTVKIPFIFSTGEVEVLTVATDISARRQAMDALTRAKEAAEVSSHAKTKFLAAMSHELRTPLNHIMGFSEMIFQETLGAIGQSEYKKYATDIYASGDHLLTLIERILEYSRFEEGEIAVNAAPTDLNRLAVRLVGEFMPTAEEKSISLVSDLDRDLELCTCDDALIARLVSNLLSNAIKFTPEGGTVTVASTGSANGESGEANIIIRDTGVGIAAKDIQTAFLPFRQLESVMNRTHEGAGLGLAVAKQIAAMHGGKIDLSSEVGVGTTAAIRLPLRKE
jgi:PAS domain S-box-containing protein